MSTKSMFQSTVHSGLGVDIAENRSHPETPNMDVSSKFIQFLIQKNQVAKFLEKTAPFLGYIYHHDVAKIWIFR